MENFFLLVVATTPHVPTIHTHDRVIQIHTCFARQMVDEAEIYIQPGVDKTNRIGQNAFLSAKPNTGQTGDNGDDF